ncbi:MAG TPA: YciI family protein [Solirubrobacteraceae bacterium]
MQYLIQIYTGETAQRWQSLSEAEQQAVSAEYFAIGEDPRVSGGAQLQPPDTATTVRVDDGRTLTTDGPFAATKEALGGYYLVEADDLDSAIEFASRVPAARLGGAVEVRPLVPR